jgi:hypothetical protein
LIALIAGTVVVVLIVVSVMAYVAIKASSGGAPTASGSPALSGTQIPCDQLEHTQVHYHAYLQIVADGNIVPISTSVGRTAGCYYWIHMHSNEQGIIHVEAPSDRAFTLADFFWVWGDADDGSGPHVYSGDPKQIVLKNHEMITLEITPPSLSPPPAYTWPDGF